MTATAGAFVRRRSKYRRLWAALIATLAVIAGSAFTATASSAATTSTSARTGQATHTTKKTSPMHTERVTKLVSATPDKHGDVKVQLANGTTAPIPQSTEKKVMARAAQEAAQPDTGIVTADCGQSYITVQQKPTDGTPGGTSIYDGNPVSIATGFLVNLPAVGYTWFASISGPDGYSYDYNAEGTLAADTSWNGEYDSPVDEPSGTYTAEVIPVASEAVLVDGDVCFSGGPTDSANLTAKARCLNQKPANAVATGTDGGWIENTATAVPAVNITTTPNGPGTRASTGTACLTNPLTPSNEGTGGLNITGWADAQLYAANNPTSTTLSRCHVIADILGGQALASNLFPCWQVGTNTGTPSMRTPYETVVQAAANSISPGQAVYYEVTPEYYDGSSTIPYEVVMSAKVQNTDGTSTPLFTGVVDNIPTGDPAHNLGN